MIYDRSPQWEKFRSHIFDLSPSLPAIKLFSQKAIDLSIACGHSKFDCGVVGTMELSFFTHIDEEFLRAGYFTDTIGDSSRILFGFGGFYDVLKVEYGPNNAFVSEVEHYILEEMKKEGNRIASLRHYTKAHLPHLSPYNYDISLARGYFPSERTIPMSVIQDLLIKVDKSVFSEIIPVD